MPLLAVPDIQFRHLCHTVIHKPAKCKNTPNQCCCNDQLHNHSSSCFRLINEWSCSDGTDCHAAKNDPLKVRQMDRTAADNCRIGNHKKSGAKQIEQDADHISLLHELPPLVKMCSYLHRRKKRQRVPEIDPGAELVSIKSQNEPKKCLLNLTESRSLFSCL